MKFDLEAKGLLPDQLLQDPWPDDLTIAEAQKAFKYTDEFKVVRDASHYPDQVEAHFCWRHRGTGREWILAGECTLGQWASPSPGIEALIVIADSAKK